MRYHSAILLFAAGVLIASLAHAQTGPALMLKPWPEGKYADFSADAYFFGDGHTDRPRGSQDFDLSIYDARGRFSPDTTAERATTTRFMRRPPTKNSPTPRDEKRADQAPMASSTSR